MDDQTNDLLKKEILFVFDKTNGILEKIEMQLKIFSQ